MNKSQEILAHFGWTPVDPQLDDPRHAEASAGVTKKPIKTMKHRSGKEVSPISGGAEKGTIAMNKRSKV